MLDRSTLEAALVGLEYQRQQITEKMNAIRGELGGRPGAKASSGAVPSATAIAPKKRHMSAAARKRIAEAQKARWAAFHALKEQGK